MGLQWGITRLSVRYGAVRRWVKADPRLLLFRGQVQHEALREERVTEGELRAAVRMKGITALEDVEAVVLETDGTFSVLEQRGSSTSAMVDVKGYPEDVPGSRD